ncbi:DUF4294 domain-containing protein [Lacinutrix venerupis]|uniref:DUF4294 domain-containing protein n=1 Tax=Lacinutrix venerupis TaxID=1486034 RepID=A0AAC9LK67_9FLAO|nr:DUF4294 domain-containing protein [Lacinutrix venerupis]APY00166.1 hypothetical protein BWR22_07515 [Lacinutrix venerupis]
MKYLLPLLLIFPILIFGQNLETEQDSTQVEYIIIEGDSIPREAIDLEEVKLLHRLKFDSKENRIRYYILRRKTIKVYPYAKLAAERLTSLNERLETLDSRRKKKQYAKKVQKYIESEFSAELKKMTRTEGQILIKLIHRQTGKTTFTLIKELRNGWRAFWFNNTAGLFNISLKREFDPIHVKEDYLIEDILQRMFQQGVLEEQKPAVEFDFYELSNKWLNNGKVITETK